MAESTVMNNISNSLGMRPLVVETEDSLPVVHEASSQPIVLDQQAQEDYDATRKNLKTLLEKGTASLEALAVLAAASESPRAFEVVAKMIDTLASVNKDLFDVHKKRHDLLTMAGTPSEEEKTKEETKGTTNIFIGTTADLLQKVRDEMRGGRVIDGTSKRIETDGKTEEEGTE